jgi:hypothetical protein
MKDLSSFLGIFEISEEELRAKRKTKSDFSNTSVNIQSGFKPRNHLEVVDEGDLDSDSEQRSIES